MSFQACSLKASYRSGPDNILKDFYEPLFRHATQYDRAVGFFSSEVLEANLKGVVSLVKNNGKMRLVIGHPITDDEFEAIKYYGDHTKVMDQLSQKFNELIIESEDRSFNKLEILAWLSNNGRLEIKFALRRQGMYHEKIGIFYDEDGNKVCFTGSANETIYGLTGLYNAESIIVFPSWGVGFDLYGQSCIDGFETVWNNELENTLTLDMPSSYYERLNEQIKMEGSVTDFVKNHSEEIFIEYLDQNYAPKGPSIPTTLGGRDFYLKDHQVKSIASWQGNGYKGILELATGSGKTITSIAAAVKVYEARAKQGGKTVLVVSVPYQELASQWVINLRDFNIFPVKCWDSRIKWEEELKNSIIKFNLEAIDFLSIVVVNRTMESDFFKKILLPLKESDLMVIGDECHNHGSKKTNDSIPLAHFRMGLSATPFRSDDDEIDNPFPDLAKDRILSYYKGIVAKYSLGDAINDGVLCEYEYQIIPVYLTEDEQEKYENLSSEIGRLIGSGQTAQSSGQLTALCGQRSRLLGGAQGKLPALASLLKRLDGGKKGSLFYCGEGKSFDLIQSPEFDQKIVEQVSVVLHENGWNTSRFTSLESPKQRAKIMGDFKSGSIDALVSMKVLDEGVDVPSCNKAFILASTRNPRQYVQRRGRVLRKAEGKSKALIYDFMILPAPGANNASSKSLKSAELERIDDFCLLAINRLDVERQIDELGIRVEL